MPAHRGVESLTRFILVRSYAGIRRTNCQDVTPTYCHTDWRLESRDWKRLLALCLLRCCHACTRMGTCATRTQLMCSHGTWHMEKAQTFERSKHAPLLDDLAYNGETFVAYQLFVTFNTFGSCRDGALAQIWWRLKIGLCFEHMTYILVSIHIVWAKFSGYRTSHVLWFRLISETIIFFRSWVTNKPNIIQFFYLQSTFLWKHVGRREHAWPPSSSRIVFPYSATLFH